MDIHEIEVTIGKNGKVQLHIRGVKGLACLELTKELEQALGDSVELREMTADAGEEQTNPAVLPPRIKNQH